MSLTWERWNELQVIIRDAAGREFKTSQNIVFSIVLKSIQEVLDEKIAETEEQINFAA